MKSRFMAALLTIVLTGGEAFAEQPSAVSTQFGTLPDGTIVRSIALKNETGMEVKVITYGASLQSVLVPSSTGSSVDVLLGHPRIEDYLNHPQYFGATVGRYANRIANGRFTIGDRSYQLPTNDGKNTLHGGYVGLDKVVWQVGEIKSSPSASVTLNYVSPDGDQGYPGRLAISVRYSLNNDNSLRIEYRATTDKPTIVNITNHAYWNLAGEGSPGGAMGNILTIPADTYLPTDAGSIPTGERKSVEGTAFDFRNPTPIGARVRNARDPQIRIGRGYDHNWIVSEGPTQSEHLMARVEDPRSGRGYELWSNQPGLQFYSGNFLDGTTVGKAGAAYRQGDAFVLEPQLFPDTPNQMSFGTARLDPGQSYYSVMTYRFFARKN